MIKAVFFDLDGTLLQMDTNIFFNTYFKVLAKKMTALGYDANVLAKNIMLSVNKIMKNDGIKSNKEVFFENFMLNMKDNLKHNEEELETIFEDFYKNEFNEIEKLKTKNDYVLKLIDKCKELNLDMVIATSPVFPSIATQNRIKWAGLNYKDFKYISTYENSTYCKPNSLYYKEILNKLGYKENEILMVGNDLVDDIKPCLKLGIKTYLVKEFVLNYESACSTYEGNFQSLLNEIAYII